MFWIGYAITFVAVIGYLNSRFGVGDYDDRIGTLVLAAFLALGWPLIAVFFAARWAIRRRHDIAGWIRWVGARWSALRAKRAVSVNKKSAARPAEDTVLESPLLTLSSSSSSSAADPGAGRVPILHHQATPRPSDDLSERRNAGTMRGVVCAMTSDGGLHQDDLDEIARFKGFLMALGPLPPAIRATPEQAAERLRIYREHYPEDGSDV